MCLEKHMHRHDKGGGFPLFKVQKFNGKKHGDCYTLILTEEKTIRLCLKI